MARQIPEDRFDDLVRAATRVFIQLGYRRAQMADVAEAMGVAKGTLYVYVEGKEALFGLAARYCDESKGVPLPEELPYRAPGPGGLREMLVARLVREGRIEALESAFERARPRDVGAELREILEEIFDVLYRNRSIIKLIDRSGGDHPELPSTLQRNMREGLQGQVARYFELRSRSRVLRRQADPFLTARVTLETLTFWAVHIHWDPVPQVFGDEAARDTVVDFVLSGLLRDRSGME